jgi:hypothetical protein
MSRRSGHRFAGKDMRQVQSKLRQISSGAPGAPASNGALTMTTPDKTDPPSDAETWKYAEKALNWYGWGSPVGISIFLVSLGIVLVLIHQAGLLR